MIWAAVVVAKDGDYTLSSGKVVGVFAGLLVFHGILVSSTDVSCRLSAYRVPSELPRYPVARSSDHWLCVRQSRSDFPYVFTALTMTSSSHHASSDNNRASCDNAPLGDALRILCLRERGFLEPDWRVEQRHRFLVRPPERAMDCEWAYAIEMSRGLTL